MPGPHHARLALAVALATPLAAMAGGSSAATATTATDAANTPTATTLAERGVVAEWAAVDAAIGQSQRKLAAAEQALKQGRTPLPGERRGNVNGTSRLTPAYFDRVAALEQAVAEARQQLNQAYAQRRNLPEDRNYQGPVQAPR